MDVGATRQANACTIDVEGILDFGFGLSLLGRGERFRGLFVLFFHAQFPAKKIRAMTNFKKLIFRNH